MILKCGRVIYLGLSPYAVKPMFWFGLLANEIAGNFISSSGCGPDWRRALNNQALVKIENQSPTEWGHKVDRATRIGVGD